MLVGGSPGCADGVNGDQLQLSPPLVMTEAQIDSAVDMLSTAIEAARQEVLVAAEAEGLPLICSASGASGYKHVLRDGKCTRRPFFIHISGSRKG